MHELDHNEEPGSSSERGFGLIVAAAAAIIGLWPLLRGDQPRWWLMGAALVLLVISMLAAWVLRPLNRFWSWFGLLLNRVISPVILGIIFYGVLTPIGLILRVRGRDILRLRFDRTAASYWIAREPPGPRPNTMSRQF